MSITRANRAGKIAGGGPPGHMPEPYRPFPVHALPATIWQYVEQGALALGCDPAFLALPALAGASSLIGNTRVIRLKRTWHEPSVLWTAIIAESGTLKSPAQELAMRPIHRIERQLARDNEKALRVYRQQMQDYEEAKRLHRKGTGLNPGGPPERPISRRIVCSDTTVEALAMILQDNPRGVLVCRDELSGWLGSFSRYKGKQGGTDLPNWLEMQRAGPIIYDRKTGEPRTIYVPRAAVPVTGGIQPGVFRRHLSADYVDSGLVARLLLAMPPKLPKRWTDLEIDPATTLSYEMLLDSLLALEMDTDHSGERVPHVLTLTPDAKKVWVAYYNRWAREQVGVEGELAATFSKLEAYAARFALLHHVVEAVAAGKDDLAPVEDSSVKAGTVLADWFAGEARRIYAMLAESAEESDIRRLVEYIQTHGGKITARNLQKSNSRKYPDADKAEAALDALVQAGYGAWVLVTPSAKGGRPTKFFELRPTPPTPGDTDTTADEGVGSSESPPAPSADITPDRTPRTPQNSRETRGSVGNAGCRTGNIKAGNPAEGAGGSRTGCVGRTGIVSDADSAHGDAWEGPSALPPAPPPAPPPGAVIRCYGYDGQRCPREKCITWDWVGGPRRYPLRQWPIPDGAVFAPWPPPSREEM